MRFDSRPFFPGLLIDWQLITSILKGTSLRCVCRDDLAVVEEVLRFASIVGDEVATGLLKLSSFELVLKAE